LQGEKAMKQSKNKKEQPTCFVLSSFQFLLFFFKEKENFKQVQHLGMMIHNKNNPSETDNNNNNNMGHLL